MMEKRALKFFADSCRAEVSARDGAIEIRSVVTDTRKPLAKDRKSVV